jgi:hypothetical protein
VIADDFDETPEDLIAAFHGDTGRDTPAGHLRAAVVAGRGRPADAGDARGHRRSHDAGRGVGSVGMEMAIKAGLGKLSIPEDLTNDVLTMS